MDLDSKSGKDENFMDAFQSDHIVQDLLQK